jgi:hypothetical protein
VPTANNYYTYAHFSITFNARSRLADCRKKVKEQTQLPKWQNRLA